MARYTLVTGASEGIGAEIARRAARDGRNLILTARSRDKLEALAAELRIAHEIEIVVIPEDLGDRDGPARLWAAASAGREIDTLVNNAGLGANGPFDQTDWPREALMIQVNLVALTELMKLAVIHMKALGRGRILNVASVASFVSGPNMAVYHATKAYVLSLSDGVAGELAGTDITVTALCPGATKTEFFGDAGMEGIRLIENEAMMATAASVADAGWTAMRAGRRVEVPGAMNKILAFLPRLLPRSVLSLITKQFYKRD